MVSCMSETRTRTVAYLRVSTDKQADRGVNLEAQRAKAESYAALYDLELVAIEVDAGESGKSLARPALDRALAMLRTGKADALLVVKLDRLTRSVREARALRSAGLSLRKVAEMLDSQGLRARNGRTFGKARHDRRVVQAGGPRSGSRGDYRSANYRAGEGIRTLDVNLGKVALYH